jgi:catechol 2,3-dioxygenase-like lactoylglutathione lyase family enzyme
MRPVFDLRRYSAAIGLPDPQRAGCEEAISSTDPQGRPATSRTPPLRNLIGALAYLLNRGARHQHRIPLTAAVITPDPPASRKLYLEALGLPLEGDEYLHSEQVAGCKSFGIWPLSQAAEACFGTAEWPAERPVPQVSIEFDVTNADAVDPAVRELQQAGYELLHPAREEPWGQTVARLQSPEGAIIGISHIPIFHDPA